VIFSKHIVLCIGTTALLNVPSHSFAGVHLLSCEGSYAGSSVDYPSLKHSDDLIASALIDDETGLVKLTVRNYPVESGVFKIISASTKYSVAECAQDCWGVGNFSKLVISNGYERLGLFWQSLDAGQVMMFNCSAT